MRGRNFIKAHLVAMGILCITAVSGCGSESNADIQATKSITVTESSTSEETSDVTSSESASTETTGNADIADTEPTTAADTTIDEQVLLDANDIKITATEYTSDSIWGDGIKLLIENNGTEDVGVGSDAVIVNNYMISDLLSAEVAPGKKSNETLYLMSSELESAGITNIGQIEVYFHLFNPDSYATTYTADPVTIKTNKFDQMDTEPKDDGLELYDADGLRIVGKYVDEDNIWGNAVVLYLENTTDQNVVFQCDDMSINGFMVTPYFSSTVYPGKMAISDITLMDSELEENGIESVDDIELTFHIFDEDTFETILNTDPISFSTK
jgi:hypothetical protein